MRNHLPFGVQGQKIGLLGGSFDPPHAGHMHISKQALRRFGLDQVWWLVSPGNPLKTSGPAEFSRRFAACKAMADHPRIHVSDFEEQAGLRYTADTLAHLIARRTDLRFVWLMGADNLNQIHKWDRWRAIFDNIPIGVMARPAQVVRAGLSPAARCYAHARISARQSFVLAQRPAPVWSLVSGPTVQLSSTEIRQGGQWFASSDTI